MILIVLMFLGNNKIHASITNYNINIWLEVHRTPVGRVVINIFYTLKNGFKTYVICLITT